MRIITRYRRYEALPEEQFPGDYGGESLTINALRLILGWRLLKLPVKFARMRVYWMRRLNHYCEETMRKPFVAGNWKMNKTGEEARALVAEMLPNCRRFLAIDRAVCPPFPT